MKRRIRDEELDRMSLTFRNAAIFSKREFDLDTPLIHFGNDPLARITWRQACTGLLCTGSIGSGKTSGVGTHILSAYLRNGAGALITTVKRDDINLVRACAKEAGREQDVCVIEPDGTNRFNFMQFLTSHESEVTYAQNVLKILENTIKAADQRDSEKTNDPFWNQSLRLLLNNLISLMLMAYGNIASITKLHEIAESAPMKREHAHGENSADDTQFVQAFKLARENVKKQIDAWYDANESLIGAPPALVEEKMYNDLSDFRTLKRLDHFFMDGFYNISEKTRSILSLMLSSFLQMLLEEPIYSLFCQGKSTVSPDSVLDGTILVLNLPTKVYGEAGRNAQTLVKAVFQMAFEKRDIKVNERPVCIYSDECSNFLTEMDSDFQLTARSSRICTVMLTQNINTFHSHLGGDTAKYRIKSLLSTLGIKIWCLNSCVDTNEWASVLIGNGYFEDYSESVQVGGSTSLGKSTSLKFERIVKPEEFMRLRSGGPPCFYKVDAYLVIQGVVFSNGFTHKKITFKQIPNN